VRKGAESGGSSEEDGRVAEGHTIGELGLLCSREREEVMPLVVEGRGQGRGDTDAKHSTYRAPFEGDTRMCEGEVDPRKPNPS